MNKRALLSVHRWLAIPLSVLILIQVLSGIALVYREEIEEAIHPELIVSGQGPQISAQNMLDSVRTQYPDAALKRIEFHDSRDRANLVRLSGETGPVIAALDPYSGQILRAGGLSSWPMEWIFLLHDTLLSGDIGTMIVGIEGIASILIALLGVIVWWPGAMRLRSGFRLVLDRTADLRWRTVHRAVGAVCAVFLLLSAVTGTLMIYKGEIRDALTGTVPISHKPLPGVTDRPGEPFLPLDLIIAEAAQSPSAGPLRQLRFSDQDRVVGVYFDSRNSSSDTGYAQFYYNRYTGEHLDSYIAGRLPAASEFIDWLYPIHAGLWGGAVTRLILLLTGLASAGLTVTGLWLWWTRTRKARRRKAAV